MRYLSLEEIRDTIPYLGYGKSFLLKLVNKITDIIECSQLPRITRNSRTKYSTFARYVVRSSNETWLTDALRGALSTLLVQRRDRT